MVLETGGKSRVFEWKNVTNQTYYPELAVADINQDRYKELLIFATTGYGTGIREMEPHVVAMDTLREYTIQDANAVVQEKVHFRTQGNQFTVEANGKTTTINKPTLYDGTPWDGNTDTSSIVGYTLMDNKLMAIVNVSVPHGPGLGQISITYGFENGLLFAEKIEFQEVNPKES